MFDLVVKAHSMMHVAQAGGFASHTSLAHHQHNLTKLEVDPQETVVNYSTGSGMRPIPVSFCVMSSATGNCTSDSMIDLQDPATQVKLAKSNNGKGPTPSFAKCLYGASNGGADPITMDAFIEHCGRGTSTVTALSH
mmetsp:Transcript_66606/g.108075  ORF Transcript_66606/g.108075 Transcript_66606/m.108075 type:complete len:137 (-) Transcript_66606:255-665(-)